MEKCPAGMHQLPHTGKVLNFRPASFAPRPAVAWSIAVRPAAHTLQAIPGMDGKIAWGVCAFPLRAVSEWGYQCLVGVPCPLAGFPWALSGTATAASPGSTALLPLPLPPPQPLPLPLPLPLSLSLPKPLLLLLSLLLPPLPPLLQACQPCQPGLKRWVKFASGGLRERLETTLEVAWQPCQ